MATLHFPLGVITGRLVWDDEDEKLTDIELKNASIILFYMGYDVYENDNEKEIDFGLRLFKHKDDGTIFRDILFDFTFLFSTININLPDMEYAKTFLGEFFIPFDKRNRVTETRAIVYNDIVHLTYTQNFMVSGKGYSNINREWYPDMYQEGKELFPIISEDIILDVVLLIKADANNGHPYNDPYASYNNREDEKKEDEKDENISEEDELPF